MGIRTILTTSATVVVSLLCAASAYADSAALTVTDAAGQSDPAAEVGRTFTAAGNSGTPKKIFASYRATGGAACAPSAATDSGLAPRFLPYGDDVNGDFAIKYTGNWPTAGSFLFCFWIADSSSQAVTPFSQVVTFRPPRGTLATSVAPPAPWVGTESVVALSGASEAPKSVFATYRPANGAACAPTAESDPGRALPGIYGVDVDGSFQISSRLTLETIGSYLVCVWLADYSGDPSPIAGPLATTFSVVSAPPPCRVPSVRRGTSVRAVLDKLTKAGCTAGRIFYQASKRYRRRTLIKLRTRAGASLPAGQAISFIVSTGKPCVVPKARGGVSLKSARARLLARGCRSGSVRKVRSRRKVGTLVRFSPRSGRKLKPRSKVTIYISRGR